MGARARRTEDAALLRGAGQFTDDFAPEGMVHAAVLRSSMAQARITVGELSAIREMPGVRLVMTSADLEGIFGLPCKGKIRQVDGTHPKLPPHPLLFGDTVRHVGDPIAFVVADTVERARAAAERIEVDHDSLPTVVDMRPALEDSAPLVWPDLGSNVAFTCARGAKGATDAMMVGGGLDWLMPRGDERHCRRPESRVRNSSFDMPATPERVWTAIQNGP
ncbi:MAG: hypothetical protein GY798_22560 [Hyphomicrobiales bacterium]|nr:hypothetical protein [Hyphomicrobiales bacterium]